MTNRTEEYWALVRELAQPPRELEDSVERARKKARRTRLIRTLGRPAAALAGAAACFVLLVNTFPTFALACSGVPIIRELTAAVAFSPSLSAAVTHDYVQYIGQAQTAGGVAVNLEYAIVDAHKAIFFYSADGARLYTSPDLTGTNGEAIGGYAVTTYDGGQDKPEIDSLSSVTFDFVDRSGMPDQFTVSMLFMPGQFEDIATVPVKADPPDASLDSDNPYLRGDPREDPGVLRFTFDVTLDSSRIAQPITVPVDRWVELDGQRILVNRLEYSPTCTVLYLGEDGANTAWLKSLKFWFEDEKGARYDDIDGSLSARGAEDVGSKSMLTYYFQSFYYDQPKGLALCIDKAEWLDKDAPHAALNLTTGDCINLPDGVRVNAVNRTGNTVEVKFHAPLERRGFGQTFAHHYWDPEGGQHEFNEWGFGNVWDEDTHEVIAVYEIIYLKNYPWDTAELELSYTAVSKYDQPVRIPLTAASAEK